MAPKSKEDLAANLAKLSLQTTGLDTTPSSTASKPAPKKTTTTKKPTSPVADSWEDEADSDSDSPVATPIARVTAGAGTSAPPPTPMSPVAHTKRPFSPSALSSAASATPDFSSLPPFDGAGGSYPPSSSSSSSQPGGGGPAKRPEKTDAVARRMIASALGMRAPKQTEEQKAYDKAVREKERKRREEEKERERVREEERERARQAVWDD